MSDPLPRCATDARLTPDAWLVLDSTGAVAGLYDDRYMADRAVENNTRYKQPVHNARGSFTAPYCAVPLYRSHPTGLREQVEALRDTDPDRDNDIWNAAIEAVLRVLDGGSE